MRSPVSWLEERFNLTEIFSFLTNFGLFPAELDTRLPLRQAITEALRRPTPSYARWPRVLGILSVLLFGFLGLTGAMLALYYRPTASDAYESVTIVVRDVSFGWFVQQVHRWAGHALLGILLLRLWRFFFQGVYRAPREAIWIVALLTFLVATHADLTGRLLRWDASGYWTTVRAVEILFSLPVLGPLFAFVIGGQTIDSIVLIRFYFLHVVVLPAMLLAFFFLHFSGVRRVGLSSSRGEQAPRPSAWRVHVYSVLILAVVMLGGLVTLATLLPAPFGKVADPLNTPAGIRPPWYLLATYGFLESSPSSVPRWIPGLMIEAILAVCLLLPFIDRSRSDDAGRRRVVFALGVAVLAAWVFFSWHGYNLEASR